MVFLALFSWLGLFMRRVLSFALLASCYDFRVLCFVLLDSFSERRVLGIRVLSCVCGRPDVFSCVRALCFPFLSLVVLSWFSKRCFSF